MTSANPAAGQSPTEAPELAPGTLVEGRYRVVRLIGVGGTGVVYEVEHTLTSQRLALKTLLDRAQAPRLEQEGRALARLRSPHVVKVVDLGTAASEVGPFLVMTLLVGRNLRDVLEGRQKLSLSFVANVAVQVCEGLEEAHRAGLVHRDLKPDNIHLADPAPSSAPRDKPSGNAPHELAHATVFDFGVVKVAATEQTSQLTRTGSTVGTPYYMSLEQLRGSGTVDALSDVYALCVVLYECLAGARPFEAGTLGDLIYAICSTTPAHLSTLRPDLPKPVVDTIMNGLSRVKEERPRSMRDLAIALEPYADKGFTVWLRLPEQAGAGALPGAGAGHASPPAPPVAPPAPATGTASAINVPKATLGTDTATGPGTATTPRPRFPRPTQQLQRPPPKAPGGPSAAPPPPARPAPPTPPKALASAAAPDPALLQSQDIVADPTTSSLDGTTPVEDEPVHRDRETPTEMYVREVHGEVAADAPAQVPTMSLPATASPTFGSPFATPDPSTLDSGDKTAVLELDAVQAQVRTAAPSFGAGPPSASPHSHQQGAPPSFGQPPSRAALSTSSPPNGIPAPAFPQMQPRPQMHSGSFSAAELGMAPSWKTRVDEAFSSLGKRGNDLGVKTLARFRSASQEQQIVIVVVVTATVAVLLVGFVYLLVV